jgi:hypothetical protein
MRFRIGVVIGFGVGYYLGAKAGRQRYEQIQRWFDKAKNSEIVDTVADKAKAVVDLGVERARDLTERRPEGANGFDEDERTALVVEVPLPPGGNGPPSTP